MATRTREKGAARAVRGRLRPFRIHREWASDNGPAEARSALPPDRCAACVFFNGGARGRRRRKPPRRVAGGGGEKAVYRAPKVGCVVLCEPKVSVMSNQYSRGTLMVLGVAVKWSREAKGLPAASR